MMEDNILYFLPKQIHCPFCWEEGELNVLGPFTIFFQWDMISCGRGHSVRLKDCGKQFAIIKDIKDA